MTQPIAENGPTTPPRMWLVRHGQTAWSASGRHTGWTDVPLTDLGRAEARAIGERLKSATQTGARFADVRSSPLGRALETCRLAGFGDRVTVDADLAEWDYGADEGQTSAEIRRDRPGWSIWRDGPLHGETIDQVASRADRIVMRARSAAGDTLCFAHGHLLRILAVRWVGLPPTDGAVLALDPATVSILGWERDTAVIERWNQPGEG